jgi:hypothetical protein
VRLVRPDFNHCGETPRTPLILSQIFGPTNKIPKDLGCYSNNSSFFMGSLHSSTIKMKEAFREIGLGLKF